MRDYGICLASFAFGVSLMGTVKVSAGPTDRDAYTVWPCTTQPAAATRPAASQPGPATQPADACWEQSMHAPRAAFDARTNRTYFTYRSGGRDDDTRCAIWVGWYDHNEGRVHRSVRVLERPPVSADDGPAMVLDEAGYIWIFVGSDRPGAAVVLKSEQPNNASSFSVTARLSFSDPQPWYQGQRGFLLLCYVNKEDRCLPAMTTSRDGIQWAEPVVLADLGGRHCFVAGRHKDKIGLVFNRSLDKDHPDLYTDLYYLESRDWGQSWHSADGRKIELPIEQVDHFSRMRDYCSMKRITSIKDVNFDRMGNPTVLYMSTFAPEVRGRRLRKTWYTARWFRQWYTTGLIMSDHIGDSGCLLIDERMNWTLLATTDPGLCEGMAGGDVVMWLSRDQGRSWYRGTLTEKRHCWGIRRAWPASAEMTAMWLGADIDDFQGATIYYSDDSGSVRKLPGGMDGDWGVPASKPSPR